MSLSFQIKKKTPVNRLCDLLVVLYGNNKNYFFD